MNRAAHLGFLLVTALALIGGAAWYETRPAAPRFADANDGALVAAGAAVYAGRCAACHGAHLEGQPHWDTVGADGRVPAPPQDETGHTWMHPDAHLFRFVKFSMIDVAPADYVSPMPAFAGTLGDGDILAALAFIKSRWPVGVRVYQAMLNPGLAGMPAGIAGADWRLPADCGLEPGRRPGAARTN